MRSGSFGFQGLLWQMLIELELIQVLGRMALLIAVRPAVCSDPLMMISAVCSEKGGTALSKTDQARACSTSSSALLYVECARRFWWRRFDESFRRYAAQQRQYSQCVVLSPRRSRQTTVSSGNPPTSGASIRMLSMYRHTSRVRSANSTTV